MSTMTIPRSPSLSRDHFYYSKTTINIPGPRQPFKHHLVVPYSTVHNMIPRSYWHSRWNRQRRAPSHTILIALASHTRICCCPENSPVLGRKQTSTVARSLFPLFSALHSLKSDPIEVLFCFVNWRVGSITILCSWNIKSGLGLRASRFISHALAKVGALLLCHLHKKAI